MNILPLAYASFQGARHRIPSRDGLFRALVPMLEDAIRLRSLQVPERPLADAAQHAYTEHLSSFEAEHPDPDWDLLPSCLLAAREVLRLSGQAEWAISPVGYAYHIFPRLVLANGRFRPESFRFAARSIAFEWAAYSPAFKAEVARLSAYSLEEFEANIQKPGFLIDWSGRTRDRNHRIDVDGVAYFWWLYRDQQICVQTWAQPGAMLVVPIPPDGVPACIRRAILAGWTPGRGYGTFQPGG